MDYLTYIISIVVFGALAAGWAWFYMRWRHAGARRCCSAGPGESAPADCCGGASHESGEPCPHQRDEQPSPGTQR